jgi:hypothetical protein
MELPKQPGSQRPFAALRGSGYGRIALELSPPIAANIEGGRPTQWPKGNRGPVTTPDVFTFYNLREEARFLADVIRQRPGMGVFSGWLDREIFSDRYLISKLEAKVPQRPMPAFTRLKQASIPTRGRSFEQTAIPMTCSYSPRTRPWCPHFRPLAAPDPGE